MYDPRLVQFVEHVRARGHFKDGDWARLQEIAVPMYAEAGTVLEDRDSQHQHSYFICDGLISAHTVAGEIDRVTAIFREGQVAAHPGSLLTGSVADSRLTTLEDCELVAFPRKKLAPLFNATQDPEVLRYLVRHLAEQQQRLIDWSVQLRGQSAEQLFEHFMQQQSDFMRRVPDHILADWLGISSVHFSRLKTAYFKNAKP